MGECVGHHVRLNHQPVQGPGSIMFYTAGMLLQQLYYNPQLDGVSHVIIDEVHERSAVTDLMLIYLRRLLITTDVKIILMSASVNTDQLIGYFGVKETALIEVPGTLYPLERHYLSDVMQMLSLDPEQYNLSGAMGHQRHRLVNVDLVVDVICEINMTRPEGAILCFLTSWQDITQVHTRLLNEDGVQDRLWILPLHSHLSTDEQVRDVITEYCYANYTEN